MCVPTLHVSIKDMTMQQLSMSLTCCELVLDMPVVTTCLTVSISVVCVWVCLNENTFLPEASGVLFIAKV